MKQAKTTRVIGFYDTVISEQYRTMGGEFKNFPIGTIVNVVGVSGKLYVLCETTLKGVTWKAWIDRANIESEVAQ